MDDAAKVTLPGTWTTAGGREAGAWLRPITGADQAATIDRIGRDPAPVVATDLIGACVLLEGGEPLGTEAARALSVGERETLLWRMRAMLSGDRIDAVVTCPACDEKVSIEFQVADFLELGPAHTPGVVAERVGGRLVEFRLPSGGDLENLARRRVVDIEKAEAELAAACLLSVDGQSPTADDITELAGPIGERMAVLDPAAELLFDSVCPVCGFPITASLDATGFLLEEMSTGARYLFHEVHVLASTYHWSEGEILELTPRRRHLYLDLINDAGGQRLMSGYLARLAARAVGMSPPGAPPAMGQIPPAFPPSFDHLDTVSDTGITAGVPPEPPPAETPPLAPPETAAADPLPPLAPTDTPDAATRVPPMLGNEADSAADVADIELADVAVARPSPVAAARPAVQPAVEAAPSGDEKVVMPVSLPPTEASTTGGDVADRISATTAAVPATVPVETAVGPGPTAPPPLSEPVTTAHPTPRLETLEIVAAAPAPPEPQFPPRPDVVAPTAAPLSEPAPIDVHIGTIEITAEPPPQGATRTAPPRPGLDEYARLRTYQWDDRGE